jgi:hypothetical protein
MRVGPPLLPQPQRQRWWQERLLLQEVELTQREKALVKVSADLDAEQAKTKNTHHEYLGKMRAHTDHTKHTLNLDKMLGEKKVQLDEKEWDLAL